MVDVSCSHCAHDWHYALDFHHVFLFVAGYSCLGHRVVDCGVFAQSEGDGHQKPREGMKTKKHCLDGSMLQHEEGPQKGGLRDGSVWQLQIQMEYQHPFVRIEEEVKSRRSPEEKQGAWQEKRHLHVIQEHFPSKLHGEEELPSPALRQ
jgi:hypothetical protein